MTVSHNVPVFTTRRMPGVRRMSDPGPYGPPREYYVICREIDGLRSFLPQTHIPSASVWKRTFPFSQSAFLSMDQFPYGNVPSLALLNFQSKIRVNRLPALFDLPLSLFFRRISCSYNVPVFTTRRMSGVRRMPGQGRMSAA